MIDPVPSWGLTKAVSPFHCEKDDNDLHVGGNLVFCGATNGSFPVMRVDIMSFLKTGNTELVTVPPKNGW